MSVEEELQKTTFSETDGGAPLMRDTKLVQSVVYSLPEKYEVLERLGRGGMGTRCEQKENRAHRHPPNDAAYRQPCSESSTL